MSGRRPPASISPVVADLHRRIEVTGLSGYRLALLTGLPKRTIQRFLAGSSSPTLSTIEAVAKAVGATVSIQSKRKPR